ncbi:MAG: TraR/DksA C4-type zinc finger protein [Bacillota bacterium]
MDATRLAHFRERLLAEARRYREQIDRINATGLGQAMTDAYGEFSLYDNHPADAGTEMFEREKDLGLRWAAEQTLEAIQQALDRIDAGTYGRCEACGGPIPEERLEALPMATLCLPCQEAREARPDGSRRPVEEEVLAPPFGRTFRDRSTFVGFDGEDALQAAYAYGSSDTPQDLPGAVTYDDLVRSLEQPGVVEPVEAAVDETGEPLQTDDPGRFAGE